jgi:hypothetical protein
VCRGEELKIWKFWVPLVISTSDADWIREFDKSGWTMYFLMKLDKLIDDLISSQYAGMAGLEAMLSEKYGDMMGRYDPCYCIDIEQTA